MYFTTRYPVLFGGLPNNKYSVFITRKSAMLFLIQLGYRIFNYSRAVIPVKLKTFIFPNIKLLN